jgi:hypothetical protein
MIVLAGSAGADSITLDNGQVYEGEITAEKEGRIQIKLKDSGVRLWFSRDKILDFEKTKPKKPEVEKSQSSSVSESTPLDDDVERAQALLDKMRAEQPETHKRKNNKNKRGKNSDGENDKKPKVEIVTYSDEQVEALIQQMRFGKTIYDKRNACIELGKTESMLAVQHLIAALDDDLLFMRKAANESLKQITKEDFGFDPTAKRNVRIWAQERWKDWHKKIKDEKAKETLKSYF